MNQCLLIEYIFLHLCAALGSTLTCGTPPMCCQGYQIDIKNNRCTKCSSGYQGPNCSYACRYPNYGDECQLQCDCAVQYCDHITGCGSEQHNFTTMNTQMINRYNRTMMIISVCILTSVFILIIGFYLKVKSMQSTHLTYILQYREQNTNKMSDTQILSSNL